MLAVVAIIAVSGPLPAMAGAIASPHQSTGGVSAAVTEAGSALYQSQCASCHGLQGQGAQYGPSLIGAGAAAADFYLRTGRMPLSAPGQPVVRRQMVLTDEQVRLLVDVVASMGDGPEIPQVTAGGDVSDGSRLYIANCAACHQATGMGVPGTFPALAGSKVVNGPKEEQIALVLNGKPDSEKHGEKRQGLELECEGQDRRCRVVKGWRRSRREELLK